MHTPPQLSKALIESLAARQEERQWEQLIAALLKRLELHPQEKADAEHEYQLLGDSIARKLNLPRHDVEVWPQGSMRTQTTISPRHPTKFDIDIFVKLTGPGYDRMDSETMFQEFGQALKGNEAVTGEPKPKRRCWRLQYPNKPFYFDVTPAVRGLTAAGGGLRVRDPETTWAPTNPRDFADWFCTHAEDRFEFASSISRSGLVLDHASVEPLPQEAVGLDDILRRTVQLMKLHRDNMYHLAADKHKEAQPISVIIVTLVTEAYADLLKTHRRSFNSPLEVVLKLVEKMPDYIKKNGAKYSVPNPKLVHENFADRWNFDGGDRAAEFSRWHTRLQVDLAKLLYQGSKTAAEADIREVFGSAGVEAWRASRPKSNVLDSLLSSASSSVKSNLTAPVKPGSAHTLG
jgi:hypothetical protein